MGDQIRTNIVKRQLLLLLGASTALGVALLPAPAAGQYGQYGAPPPQNVPDAARSEEASAAPASSADLLRAASCLVGRDAAAGAALLASAPYSPEERREAVRALRAAERCLRSRGGIATSPLMLRGALAETLYEAQFAQPPARRDPPAAAAPLLGTQQAAARPEMAPAFALADCTASGQPELVRALLAADPASAAEGAALQALNPVFGQCVTAGTSLNIDRASLRFVLGEALYRWSVVQRDGPASPWAAPATRRAETSADA